MFCVFQLLHIKMDPGEPEFCPSEYIHDHCFSCYNSYCSETPAEDLNCKVIDCEVGCGARLHTCKVKDHYLWCPLVKAPCINCENGCPILIPRWKLGIHLETCPASVIRCSSEWNRWPLHSQDMKAKAAIPLDNPHIRCAQLDVALAMRDQRMLIESLKAPVRTRRVLRNALTKRFPAVPFDYRSSSVESDMANSVDTSHSVSDDDSDAPWESWTSPPGLQRSVCSQLYRASQQTTESLSAALDVVANHINSPLTGIVEGNEMMDLEDHSAVSQSDPSSLFTPRPNTKEDMGTKNVTTKPTTSHIGQSKSLTDNLCLDQDDALLRKSSMSKVSSEPSLGLSTARPLVDYSKEIENEAKRLLSLKEPMKLNEVLGVDINIESITRYQPKPPAMYTFLCAQEFRRDEYPWHFKNVHNDIHCLLNGWLEQRCPLACYGCEFSFQRFCPTEMGSEVVHSMISESFGVRPPYEKSWACYHKDAFTDMQETSESGASVGNDSHDITAKEREATPEISTSYKYDSDIHIQPFYSKKLSDRGHDEKQDLLTTLPYEVLHRIARSLDSFSLSNLALTSKFLRELCCNMLEERGVVVQVWEKKRIGQRNFWNIAYKVK